MICRVGIRKINKVEKFLDFVYINLFFVFYFKVLDNIIFTEYYDYYEYVIFILLDKMVI